MDFIASTFVVAYEIVMTEFKQFTEFSSFQFNGIQEGVDFLI